MASKLHIRWSQEAVNNLEDILAYLTSSWTTKETQTFKSQLSKIITIIETSPKTFPTSLIIPDLRKAVVNKHTILFYQISKSGIDIVYLFNPKRDPKQIIK